jgi:hypothetical protein
MVIAECRLEHQHAFESGSFPWPLNIEKINGGFRIHHIWALAA